MPTITVALDQPNRRRDLKLAAGDDTTLSVVVYAVDGDPSPVAVTNLTFTGNYYNDITIPLGAPFTVPDNTPGRRWYRIKGDIGGLTTTLCYGILQIFSDSYQPGGDDYGWGTHWGYPA